MNRIIKVRAWDGNEFLPLAREVAFIDDEGVLRSRIEGIIFNQSTELHDKHDKEIYEGDILRSELFPGGTLGPFHVFYVISWGEYFVTVPGNDYEETEEQRYVGWRYTSFSSLDKPNRNREMYFWGLGEMQENVEVIGNIYETPDLLKRA